MKCLKCGNETDNPKFCGRSCATSYNNKHKPKRIRKKKYCKECNVEVSGHKLYCEDCNERCNKNYVDWSKITYGDLKDKRKYQKNSQIRDLARKKYVSGIEKCAHCEYDKHVEVHHLREISTFPDEALIAEINDVANIILLCPNCHWEIHNK